MKRTTIFRSLPIAGSILSVLDIIVYIKYRNAGEGGFSGLAARVYAWAWLIATVLVVLNAVVLVNKLVNSRQSKKTDKITLYLTLTSFVLYGLLFVFIWALPSTFRGV